jgi:hypothetical protein
VNAGGRSIYWGLMMWINPLGVPPVRRCTERWDWEYQWASATFTGQRRR